VVKIVRLRDVGFTADFENARQAWLSSSRTKSKFVKLLSDIFLFIYFLSSLKFYSILDSRNNKRELCIVRWWSRCPFSRKMLIHILWYYLIHIYIDIFVNCNWVATRWQLYSTHLHTNNTQNDTKQTTHRTTQKFWEQLKNFGRVRAVPRLGELYPGICLTTEEKARKNLLSG
jgi:hypothetical protein